MKKLLIGLFLALSLLILSTYLFIPSSFNIVALTGIKTTDNGTERFLMDNSKWPLWWNYSNTDSTSSIKQAGPVFELNGDSFELKEKFYKSINIQIHHTNDLLKSKLVMIRLELDSTRIEWQCNLPSSVNPIKRFVQFREAKKIKNTMDQVLKNLNAFLSKIENVYGIPIERNYLKDTLYLTSKKMVSSYPSNMEIYQLIKNIQSYAGKNNTHQTGNPIFNITDFGNNHFQLMAGIPVDLNIPEEEGFSLKHMVRGSFMITEVVGGEEKIKQATKNLQLYFSDFHRTSMAMNFNMLVTDRMLQPDSAKWITKIYFPVF